MTIWSSCSSGTLQGAKDRKGKLRQYLHPWNNLHQNEVQTDSHQWQAQRPKIRKRITIITGKDAEYRKHLRALILIILMMNFQMLHILLIYFPAIKTVEIFLPFVQKHQNKSLKKS